MRKLSYVEQILEVKPVENSDNLDVVTIRGWEVVTKRGEFSKGDLCVYFEIDSVLPQVPIFEFLRNKRFRIKTIKLRGQLSQGLALPVNLIEKEFNLPKIDKSMIGECLDKVLNIRHIDELLPSNPNYIRSNFPSFIRKTDQERIQNIPLEKIVNQYYEVSIKLDGSSMTVFYNNRQFGICSRNQLFTEGCDSNNFIKTSEKNLLHIILPQYCEINNRNLALQGELIGEGIQKNKEKIKGTEYYIFDIWDIDKQEYLTPKERFKILTDLNLDSVPILYDEPLFIDENVSKIDILNMADGESLNSKIREGIVFKRIDGKFSFKAISNKFLLKE